MRLRYFSLLLLVILLGASAPAKDKLDPQTLMTKSDALYYYPAEAGVKDLAVDVVIEQLAAQPSRQNIRISYLYAGDTKQQFAVANLTDDKLRAEIDGIVSPLADYLMPRSSASSFTGFTLKASVVSRSFAGLPDTEFYQLVGMPATKDAAIKEYRVLLDKTGLAHQVENVFQNGSTVVARIENLRNGEKWQIKRVITRLMTDNTLEWRIYSIEYADVEGFSLPEKIEIQYRDHFNKPLDGVGDLSVRFKNYQINKGVAAAALATPAGNAAPGGK